MLLLPLKIYIFLPPHKAVYPLPNQSSDMCSIGIYTYSRDIRTLIQDCSVYGSA